jgi:hypothetical protein
LISLPSKYLPTHRLNIIVGNYGSGKTEVSVNLALALAERHPVQIVDLDIVNPYFRCREAREEMEAAGIRVIYPKGEFHAADLPILLPEVKGTLSSGEGYVIFDVGGDDVGARILSSLADVLADREYAMLQVINTRRPFTGEVEGCLRIKKEIEAASRLRITGIIANTHLMDETEAATVLDGIETAREVAERGGLTLEFATVDPGLHDRVAAERPGCPLLPVERRMLPPWRLKNMTDRAGRVLKKDKEP